MLTKDRARVIVWAYSTDTDTWGLAEDLYSALKDSGWTIEDSRRSIRNSSQPERMRRSRIHSWRAGSACHPASRRT